MTYRAAALFVAGCLSACGGSRDNFTAPSVFERGSSGAAAEGTTTFGQFGVSPSYTPIDFARCLSDHHEPACFTSPVSRLQARAAGDVGAPTGLVAFLSGSTVTLTWTPPADPVIAYVLEAGTFPGSSNLASLSTGNTGTTYVATGVAAGTYYVRIRALSLASQTGPTSNEISVTVTGSAPCSTPGAPSELTLITNAGGTVSLSWTASAGSPTSYIVEAGSASGLANLANSDLGLTTTLTANSVSPATYYVRVKAKNACGTGAASNEVSFTVTSGLPTPTPTPCTVPSAPSGLVASVTGGAVRLTWATPTGSPTSYVVEVGTGSGLANVVSTEVGSASFTTTLTPGSYFARVKGKNACGIGASSSQISLTVAALWTQNGTGDTVFDMPTTVARVRITGTYTGTGANFIVYIAGRLKVNEIIGTRWPSTMFEGTYVTTGGVVEIVSSTGVVWTFTEVR